MSKIIPTVNTAIASTLIFAIRIPYLPQGTNEGSSELEAHGYRLSLMVERTREGVTTGIYMYLYVRGAAQPAIAVSAYLGRVETRGYDVNPAIAQQMMDKYTAIALIHNLIK